MVAEERLPHARLPVPGAPLLEAEDIVKRYGATVAVDGTSIVIEPGEVVGLVGANGAGKSTLMRILSGVTHPDSGVLRVEGNPIQFSHYSPSAAKRFGLRVVYQELSLCTNLTVCENFFIEQARLFRGLRWRRKAREAARDALAAVFPGNDIDPSWEVGNLTVTQRQMVEIARAATDPDLRLLILDEPTSSLDAESTSQLERWVGEYRARGISFIFISHRLKEVLRLSDRVIVMRNGRRTWDGASSAATEATLIQHMGGAAADDIAEERPPLAEALQGKPLVEVDGYNSGPLHDVRLAFRSGEIVGLAGLEGSGQRSLLQAVFRAAHRSVDHIHAPSRVAMITGDRAKEGVFPLWSIQKNMTITKTAWDGFLSQVGGKPEESGARTWYERLQVAGASLRAPILSLSGGNQQKVLIARALMANADVILLDDPTRGVDVGTKRQLYHLFAEVARQGKLVIWYSTEDDEFVECDRVVVFRMGHVVRELVGAEITKDRIIDASFTPVDTATGGETLTAIAASRSRRWSVVNLGRSLVPFIALVLVFGAIGFANPASMSSFGLGLLVSAAIPLALAALSQMFIVAGSDIDLGIGPYIGLINVLSATVLVTRPWLGWLSLLVSILAYGLMGALIHWRRMPAIVVTLGASFIWLGIALTLQDHPGGNSPAWLSNLFNLSVPVVSGSVVMVVVAGIVAYLILNWLPYGTVLRGLGNNVQSIERSGWSPLTARLALYLLAGLFGTLGGLSLTGITTAADATATSSYTLLSVAAVVMGGSELLGGIVRPIGVTFGAVTLSLLGALLGLLSVSSNYQPAVQGALLFLVLALRSVASLRTA